MPSFDADWSREDARSLDSVELVCLCARDTGNTRLWAEFFRRFGPRVRFYLRRTLRRLRNGTALPPQGLNEEDDLFQNAILRLLDRDCAILKRFIGTREEEFLAFLAVIADSVVRDSLLRRRAHKRPNECRRKHSDSPDFAVSENPKGARQEEPQGLSVHSIARLKAIGLSKTAVEKVLRRVKNRVRAAIAAKGPPEERSDEKHERRF